MLTSPIVVFNAVTLTLLEAGVWINDSTSWKTGGEKISKIFVQCIILSSKRQFVKYLICSLMDCFFLLQIYRHSHMKSSLGLVWIMSTMFTYTLSPCVTECYLVLAVECHVLCPQSNSSHSFRWERTALKNWP